MLFDTEIFKLMQSYCKGINVLKWSGLFIIFILTGRVDNKSLAFAMMCYNLYL